MTVQQMLSALPMVQKIMELKLPIKKAYKAYYLAKVINEKRDFFIGEEKKLIDKFEAEVLEDGNIRFKDSESQLGFMRDHAELMNYEIEDVAAIELSFDDLGEAKFTPMEIMQLEGVINFNE
jgi:hypothetical protein